MWRIFLAESRINADLIFQTRSARKESAEPDTTIRTNTPAMKTNDLTYAIIGAAYKVHKELGPGLLENIYEEALAYQLTSEGLIIERQVPLPVYYCGIKLDCDYRLDILVNKQVIVELKSVRTVSDIFKKQLLTYLRISRLAVGLLINFNEVNLTKGISRIVNNFADS